MYLGLLPSVKTLHRSAETLPQTTSKDMFVVTGLVVIYGIYGKVTTAIQNQADNTKLQLDPADGGSDVDLCAVLDIANDAVGTLYHITGTVGDAMVATLDYAVAQASPIVLSAGDIKLTCSASNTGETEWTLLWAPLTPDGNVELAK